MEHVLPSRRARRPRWIGVLPAIVQSIGRPSRKKILVGALLAAVLGGGFMWFRDSSFAAVQRVQISGLRGPGAAQVEAALAAQARKMTTLDYSASGLERAVAPLHIVRGLQVSASFPHAMRIVVTEQPPVARLMFGTQQALVAGDGVVLGSVDVGALPSISVSSLPTLGESVLEGKARALLRVLGAAPARLLPYVAKAYTGAEGITLSMRDGLLVYFGTAERPHAKWASLVAVLASSSSMGASYIDVRMPERPAAGMPGGTGESSALAQVNATDPNSALLAASLARALNGESPIEQSTSSTVTAPTQAVAPPTEGEAPASTSEGKSAATSAGEQASAPSEGEAATAPSEGGAPLSSEGEAGAAPSEAEAPAGEAGGAATPETAVPGG